MSDYCLGFKKSSFAMQGKIKPQKVDFLLSAWLFQNCNIMVAENYQ